MKILLSLILVVLLGPLAALGLVGWGWWTFKRNERTLVERMDQYYLSLTAPAREEYLLEEDEQFEVPYMASRYSVDAVPTRILDAKGRVLGEFAAQGRQTVGDAAQLPIYLKKALVATEDGTFYEHRGVNWRAIARALLVNLRSLRNAQGGSTITQQLAKQMFTTRKKSYARKAFELFCARKLEEKFTKDQILLMYFNFAYFGPGAFGIEAASRHYFEKPASALELAEAAMLVGIIANPTKYSPFENLELAQARHRTVLTRMAKLGFIPQASVQRYSSEFWRKMAERMRAPEASFWRMSVNEAPYAVEYVRRRLLEDFSRDRLLKGGLTVHTTLDLDLQRAGQKALKDALVEANKPQPETGENADASKTPVEGALVALRPADGAVLALVGGSGFNFQNQLIRAESARPMGSSVKPFLFAVAFEQGKVRPEDEIVDEPVKYKLPGGKAWNPRNYGNKYFGKVRYDFALHKSLNSVAVRLLDSLDIDDAQEALSRATGVPKARWPRNLSLALGTADLSPLQMARAYACFVDEGRSREPWLLSHIEDRSGAAIRDWRARPEPVQALKPETAALMLGVLRGVLGPDGSARGSALRTGFNVPAAGKTGTTNDYRDAWFAGVTADLSAAVWMGHDDMRFSLGEGRAGGSLAAPTWMQFVKAAYRDRPTKELPETPAPVSATR